jgi:hypothetical protein
MGSSSHLVAVSVLGEGAEEIAGATAAASVEKARRPDRRHDDSSGSTIAMASGVLAKNDAAT